MYAVAAALMLPTAMGAIVAGSEVRRFGASQYAIQMPLQSARALLGDVGDPQAAAAGDTSGAPPMVDETGPDPTYYGPGKKAEKKARKQANKQAKKTVKSEKKAAKAVKKAEKKAARQEKRANKRIAKAKKKEEKKFKWKGKGKNGFKWRYSKPRRIWTNGEVVYEQDGVICKAASYEGMQRTESTSAELHASAVAKVFSYLCDPGPAFNVTYVEEVFAEAEASAFAQAAVKGALSCKSRNRDVENTCISYTASATAIAEATAAGHATAVADAVKQCPCMTDAVAASFASDELFVELVADATVTAEATVCVEGRARLSSVVWERCTTVLYAKLFAKAAANAAAFGSCLSPEATTQVDVFVNAEVTVDNTPQCDVEPKVVFTGADSVEES